MDGNLPTNTWQDSPNAPHLLHAGPTKQARATRENFSFSGLPVVRRRRAGRPQRSGTGPVRRPAPEQAKFSQHAHGSSRCALDGVMQECLSVVTNAIGGKQTRGGTFSGLDVLGEMAPVVEEGSDGQSRREAVDARSVRLPTSSAEPAMTAEKSHRFALTGSDLEGRTARSSSGGNWSAPRGAAVVGWG
jgi:hypothetical protein